jgi:hypothetical protein
VNRDNNVRTQSEGLIPRLFTIAGAMLVTMTIYETLKQFIFPDISIWGSHLITIIFSTIVATIAGYIILEKQIKLNTALSKKNAESNALRMELESTINHLNTLLSKVKMLSGMLPICASCKKIRDDKGYWNQIESYIREHSDADFSHSLCPDCAVKLYPQYKEKPKDDT